MLEDGKPAGRSQIEVVTPLSLVLTNKRNDKKKKYTNREEKKKKFQKMKIINKFNK